MAKRESVFGDEWRTCLREHYKYVIRENDTRTETTFTPILYDVGFREDDLQALYREATMRSDDLPDDFVPDMQRAGEKRVEDAVETAEELPLATAGASFVTHPAECQCAACMDEVLEIGHDADGQPLVHPANPEAGEGHQFQVLKPEDAADGEDAPDDDADRPQQMSMF